jgi:hypothetical protein
MVGKKGSTKAKGKDFKAIAIAGDIWTTSNCSEAELKALVDEGLLQAKKLIRWHAATSDKRPYEGLKK